MENLNKLKNYTILYAEDDEEVRVNISNILNNFCKKVFSVTSTAEALEIYNNNKIDILYTDINMVGDNGLELVKIIRKENTCIPIVILTAHSDTDYLITAIPLGLEEYLLKPIKYQSLKDSLSKCVEKLTKHDDDILLFYNGIRYEIETNLLIDTDNKMIKLQYKEKILLKLLLENKNQITSYYQIEQFVWEGEKSNKGTLKVLIVKLRKKIGKNTIITENELGYRLVI